MYEKREKLVSLHFAYCLLLNVHQKSPNPNFYTIIDALWLSKTITPEERNEIIDTFVKGIELKPRNDSEWKTEKENVISAKIKELKQKIKDIDYREEIPF